MFRKRARLYGVPFHVNYFPLARLEVIVSVTEPKVSVTVPRVLVRPLKGIFGRPGRIGCPSWGKGMGRVGRLGTVGKPGMLIPPCLVLGRCSTQRSICVSDHSIQRPFQTSQGHAPHTKLENTRQVFPRCRVLVHNLDGVLHQYVVHPNTRISGTRFVLGSFCTKLTLKRGRQGNVPIGSIPLTLNSRYPSACITYQMSMYVM